MLGRVFNRRIRFLWCELLQFMAFFWRWGMQHKLKVSKGIPLVIIKICQKRLLISMSVGLLADLLATGL